MRALEGDATAGEAAEWLAGTVASHLEDLEGVENLGQDRVYAAGQLPYRIFEESYKHAFECFDSIRKLAAEHRTHNALVLLRALLEIEVRSLWLAQQDGNDTRESWRWNRPDWLPPGVWLPHDWFPWSLRLVRCELIEVKKRIEEFEKHKAHLETDQEPSDPDHHREWTELLKVQLDEERKSELWLESWFKLQGVEPKGAPDLRAMAKATGLERMYLMVYPPTSRAAHYATSYIHGAFLGRQDVPQRVSSEVTLALSIGVYAPFLQEADTRLRLGVAETVKQTESWSKGAVGRIFAKTEDC